MEKAAQQHDSTAKMWNDYQVDRSVDNKNRLIVHYIPLVNRIVSRLMPIYGPHMCFDDLAGYGVLGLIDAVDKFIPDRGIRFEIYAAKRIKGEIIDSIREQDWASSSLRSRLKQIGNAYDELESEGGATDEKVADRIGLEVEQVREALEKSHMFNMVRFETLITNAVDGGTITLEETIADNPDDMPDEQLTQREFMEVLKKSIGKLNDKERTIITLYYYDEIMLKDIADLLNVSAARVSQIHSRALLKIRMELEKYLGVREYEE